MVMEGTSTKVTSIGQTKSSLTNAIDSLCMPISKGKNKPGKDPARVLIFMTQMISEA